MKNKFILVLNCGSSSIKFAVVEPIKEVTKLSGLVQKIGFVDSNIQYSIKKKITSQKISKINYQEAIHLVLNKIKSFKNMEKTILAIGHRVVHGGEQFKKSVLITDNILKIISKCSKLAPLHNPLNLLGIELAMKTFPKLKHVATFDTSFHQTMPKHAHIYPIPYKLYENHAIRKYGFHGTSHRYAYQKTINLIGKNCKNPAIISAHLGNGCSITAILNGKSIDTSMGFTPLEGLVMGTRSGDIDPSIHLYLVDSLGYNIYQVHDLLNKHSGLLGISEIDSDIRTIEKMAMEGNEKAILALEIFCYRLAKYIASFVVPLGKIDFLVFTGGIGENSTIVREKTISLLKFLGFELDLNRNSVNGKNSYGIITKNNSPTAIVISTNEELMIAKDTLSLITNQN